MKGHTRNLKSATVGVAAMIALVAMLVGSSAVLAKSDVEADRALRYTPRLAAVTEADAPAKFPTVEGEAAAETEAKTEDLGNTLARAAAEIPEPVVTTPRNHTLTQSGTSVASSGGSTSGGTSSSGGTSGGTTTSSGWTQSSVLAKANSVLSSWKARYPDVLSDARVTMADIGGSTAFAQPATGLIVLNSNYRQDPTSVMNHEIWHIVEWRTTGQTDS